MGGKTATSTQQVTIPPEVMERYRAVNRRAEEVAAQPFQQYTGQFVAGLTPTQQAGINATVAASNAAQPYYNSAAQMTAAGSQGVTPQELQTQKYMNPYVENVVDATRRGLQQQQGQQLSQQQAEAIRSGAFGGDRSGISRAALMGQQGLATAQAISPLYQRGYEQALQTAQQQQGVNLTAEQANRQRQLAAGAQYGQLGTGAQQAALSGAQAMIGAGTLEQQTQQADMTARYQQFLQERGYPFQVAQFLANIAMGTGALSGSTTTTTQPAPFFSDEREKTNIQPLGKGLYAYDYKDDVRRAEETGSPMPPKRVGPMAQDIEERAPGLVVDVNDYKVVDPSRDSMGGAVMGPGEYARGGYAPGGLIPGSDLDAILKSQQQFLGPYGGQGGPYGGQAQGKPGYVPAASLPVGRLMTAGAPPQQRPSGLAEAAQTGSQIAGLAKMGLGAVETGKKWLESGKPEAGGVTSASGGLDAVGGDNNIFEDVASYFRASGGLVPRSHYAVGGGTANNAAIPYDTSTNYFPEDILETQKIDPLKPADPPKQQGGGGIGDIIGLGAKILPFFLATGGSVPRHGYADGSSVEPDLPAMGAQEAGLVPNFKIPAEYAPIIEQASRETGIPAAIIAAKIKAESGFRADKVGAAGELGPSQVRPSTARDPGYGLNPETGDLRDPRVNIPFGARYLKARGEAAGVEDWNDPAQARKGLAGYNGIGPAAQRYANNVLALVRDDGQPSASENAGLGAAKPSRPARVTPGLAGPGYIEDTPRASPFKFFTERLLKGRDIGDDTKAALTSENLWVPALAGIGSMLASKSPYLAGAVGEGFVGGTKAYTDLNKQQQDMAESRVRSEVGLAGIASGALEVKDGRLFMRVARPGGGYTLVEYQTIRNMSPAERAKYNVDPRLVEEAERFLQTREGGVTPGGPAAPAPAAPAPAAPAPAEAPAAPKVAGAPELPPNALPHEINPPTSKVDRPTTVGGISLTPEQVKRARDITEDRATFPEKDRLAEPDYFKPQYELARASENNKQQILPLVGTLAALPKDKSIATSGSLQAVAGPIMGVANNLASMLGYKLSTTDPAALQQEVDKLTTRLQGQQLTSTQQRAFAAFQELAKGVPTYLNSPEGQAKLVPQLLAETQREIDRQNFFRAWENAAAGKNGANANYAKLSSRDANEEFEKIYTEARYAEEKAALERMFSKPFRRPAIDPATGKEIKTPMEYIVKYGAQMTPDQREKFRNEYGKGLKNDILRYFGI